MRNLYTTVIVQKSRVYPPLFRSNYFYKETTLFKNPSIFHGYRTVSKKIVDYRDFLNNYFDSIEEAGHIFIINVTLKSNAL